MRQRRVELLVHLALEILWSQPAVVEDRAELLDEALVDLVTQVVQDRIAARCPAGCSGCLLDFMQSAIEGH